MKAIEKDFELKRGKNASKKSEKIGGEVLLSSIIFLIAFLFQ